MLDTIVVSGRSPGKALTAIPNHLSTAISVIDFWVIAH